MMFAANAKPAETPRRPGFTLIELLVVIVIIGVLIAILVPAVGAVRRVAKEAASKAVITSLSTGLEAFKADGRVGGGYAPSAPDTDDRRVASPYGGDDFRISGAGLLVWALSGADQLGTPGFKDFDNDTRWADDTGADEGDEDDAYALDGNGQPLHTRSGPYVEGSKVDMSEAVGGGDFVIPAETEARGSEHTWDYPVYLDGFGFPILYFRADPAGRIMADSSQGYGSGSSRGIYHHYDNAGFAYLPERAMAIDPDGLLQLSPDAGGGMRWSNVTSEPDDLEPGTFTRYIANLDIQAKCQPHNPDSYLLISPGYDGLYGTGDDIANFDHNGQ